MSTAAPMTTARRAHNYHRQNRGRWHLTSRQWRRLLQKSCARHGAPEVSPMKRRPLWLLMFVYSSTVGFLVWLFLLGTFRTRIFWPIPLIVKTARRHADRVIA